MLSRILAPALLVGVTASPAAADMIIDNFITESPLVIATAGAPVAFNSRGGIPVAQTIGGVRDLTSTLISGNGFVATEVTSGFYFFNSGSSTRGRGNLVWDGTVGGPEINFFIGLGGVDLTGGGTNNAITGLFDSDLVGTRMTINVWTNFANLSTAMI